ncbi:hypothetical protein E2320_018089, partial [Naja naja]
MPPPPSRPEPSSLELGAAGWITPIPGPGEKAARSPSGSTGRTLGSTKSGSQSSLASERYSAPEGYQSDREDGDSDTVRSAPETVAAFTLNLTSASNSRWAFNRGLGGRTQTVAYMATRTLVLVCSSAFRGCQLIGQEGRVEDGPTITPAAERLKKRQMSLTRR